MNYSMIELCSKALNKIGANEISAFDEGSMEAEIAGSLYPIIKERLIAAHPWSFATKQARLAKIAGEKAFQLPNDFLRAVCVFPKSGYKVMGSKIYASSDSLELTYIASVGEEEFTPLFVAAIITVLAAEFALTILDDTAKYNTLMRIASAELKEAKLAEAQQETPKAIRSFPLIDSRR